MRESQKLTTFPYIYSSIGLNTRTLLFFVMKQEDYDAIYKIGKHWPEIDAEHDTKLSNFLQMNDSIAQSYANLKNIVVMEIKCNLKCMNHETGQVEITVACTDMSYELIRFASTDLVLCFVDEEMQKQTLEFYAAESDCENHRQLPHSEINCVPVTHISLYLTSKTNIPEDVHIYKLIPDCTLTVFAHGIPETKNKSWEFLSNEEITHRCYMKMLFSEESVAAAYYIYFNRIDGDMLIRMKAEGEPFSDTQKQKFAYLQDLRELYVNLPYSREELLRKKAAQREQLLRKQAAQYANK